MSILITGATGLIGSELVKQLSHSQEFGQVFALVRDKQKAKEVLNDVIEDVAIVEGDIRNFSISNSIDYIVHTAAPTSSRYFVTHPVETLDTCVNGTMHVLDIAREKKVRSLVFLSSMEVYGYPQQGQCVTEHDLFGLDPLVERNSYPLSKLAAENLCYSYFKEYGVPAISLRLVQVIGSEISEDDNRVVAEFAHCLRDKKDIVLKTNGVTERSYIHINDVISAITTILQKGNPGECYNVANKQTYCSIKDMANMVAEELSEGSIKVKYDFDNSNDLGYAKTIYMNIDTSKIEKLGWHPTIGLREAFERFKQNMK